MILIFKGFDIMSFIIVAVILMMVLFSLGKYKNIFSILGAFVIIYGLTALFFFYGFKSMAQTDSFLLLGREIGRASFYQISSVWFGGNIVVSLLIIRNYMRYLKVNAPQTPRRGA